MGFLPKADYLALADDLAALRKMSTSLLCKVDAERLLPKC